MLTTDIFLRAVGLNVVLEISESCVLFETFSKGI